VAVVMMMVMMVVVVWREREREGSLGLRSTMVLVPRSRQMLPDLNHQEKVGSSARGESQLLLSAGNGNKRGGAAVRSKRNLKLIPTPTPWLPCLAPSQY